MNKKKILIVDDETDILEFLSYNFRKVGYDVFTTTEAKDALNKSILFAPDVVIIDIWMPEMTGIQMCGEMKKNEQLKNIPILFLTAYNAEYFSLSENRPGGTEYLNKPVSMKVIFQRINEMIESKQ